MVTTIFTSISLSTFFVTATFSIPLVSASFLGTTTVSIPLVTTTVSIPSSQQQSPYPSSQQQSPYPSSQQQSPYPSSQQQSPYPFPYPSYSSQYLQHPSTQLLSDEEIDNLLATLFLQIEDIMSRAVNPVYVQQSIAERFAMTLPEHLHDQIEQMIHRGKRYASEERSRTSSSSTPVMTPTLTRTDSMDTLEEIPLITQSSTSTSSLGIAIPSVTSSTLPRMNPM
ncbi:hypothetical protein GLOIN_2v1766892 [Rhizophagus irregularis DAOM 181602=DAOM 197198]|uniref:Uncharacterized protein n=1 Tax=Rhizophagus irregularis (strain DAOM 181602 / DAOM 197198 / MUCL 43194) TaxID=747089 RepID=A0A2P4QL92_RHIID|nr:hypothetical protein GLOIN_2v1766892 [Rhizophagus irregularis DAOM 181602=DAOM 197198]POG78413.1 hypothetical protein GLOIN_2v1766892 [Rhizophagus irregularis DAOM 181602=DAOM 197198]GET64672.1 hypothetical protein GLOIN_2v1766892 [Rhizophagus irregularis DAOM 181602=DAOM 197198]|eukprot:XP_025185279.1 hypothetical protein GLOIN_2v1766892 [Rhizophagus irregularis DAOM 181602=DAOM 197198]